VSQFRSLRRPNKPQRLRRRRWCTSSLSETLLTSTVAPENRCCKSHPRDQIGARFHAHQSRLSIRQSASAQKEARAESTNSFARKRPAVPRWRNQRRRQGMTSPSNSDSNSGGVSRGNPRPPVPPRVELRKLSRCPARRGHPFHRDSCVSTVPGAPQSEYDSFDRPRALPVIALIIADLD